MKRYDTKVIPMLIQFPGVAPRFTPGWQAALAEGWDPCGATHEVEQTFEAMGPPGEDGQVSSEPTFRSGRIVFGLLKQVTSHVFLPSVAEVKRHGGGGGQG